ncbi:hypothetical protein [Fluviicola sp.]|uniref:hypothetical protein n=1 Tax=Fluviicola sp. TaxID=1917219 RepID=UPI0026317D8D|nr:hypothetical protein [Fluviicola sp.]
MRILIIFLLLSSSLFAESIPDYFVRYVKDKNPPVKGARINVLCEFNDEYEPLQELKFGINGSNGQMKLDSKNSGNLIKAPQKAVFQFYYPMFLEIETDSIEIKPGQITIISLHFKRFVEPRPVKKPVIYLYPESDLEVSVHLKPRGELTFSYPDYAEGWNGVAHPDGSISIGQQNYPYLFWESEQRFNRFNVEAGGFVMQQASVTESLEKILSEMGFNTKEKADFITFWGPQLAKHSHVFVQFVVNEACNEFASLEITPKPQNINRVYMIWKAGEDTYFQFPKTQKLPLLKRNGFHVLEWGGIELTNSLN